MYVDIHSQETYWTVYDSFHLQFFFLFLVYRVVYRSGDKIEVATDSDIRGGAKVPGKMGRKKIQISRIGDERNRQVRMEIKLYIFFLLLDVVLYFF